MVLDLEIWQINIARFLKNMTLDGAEGGPVLSCMGPETKCSVFMSRLNSPTSIRQFTPWEIQQTTKSPQELRT